MIQPKKNYSPKKVKTATVLLLIILIMNTQILIGSPHDVKIGAVNMEGTHKSSLSLASKITHVAPLIAKAGELNLDIVVLPEAYFKGVNYVIDSQDLDNSVVLDSMKVFANQNNINIIFQVFEKVGSKLYNTAVVVDRNGDYVGKYRKVNLPPEESALTPGDTYEVFDLDVGKIGILICWDFWFTEPAKILAEKGAELIILSTWCNINRNLKTITAENGLPVAISVLRLNCGSGEEDLPSGVYDQYGDPVFTEHPIGPNKLAVGTVTLGNYKNVALNKSVVTSPGTNSEYPAKNAVDGLYSTERDAPEEKQICWKANSLPQWIEIDLGMDFEVDRVSIAQFEGEDYDYVIEGKPANSEYVVLSDSVRKLETFLEHGIAGSEILTSRFNITKVRYVKLTVNSTTHTEVIINEIKVFGSAEALTRVNEKTSVSTPERFYMHNNYPNPFNGGTIIQYLLAETSDVKLAIFNTRGQLVRILVDEKLTAGTYWAHWNGRNQNDQIVTSGVYFPKIQFETIAGRRHIESNKMIFIK
jgi:predicted amidohydrolase